MDPARTFKESLTSRPELENSQGHKLPLAGCFTLVGSSPGSRHCGSAGEGRQRAMSRHRSNQAAIPVRLLSGRRGSSGCDRV